MSFCRLTFVFVAIGFGQTVLDRQLQDLLSEARRAAPQGWAQLLIQADAVAGKMARHERPPGDLRRAHVQDFDLTYRWNEVQQVENYQHDLLKTVIRAQGGKPEGANALAALLGTGRQSYKEVIGLLESPGWRTLHDIRLDRILGEAYETWWSLSRAKPHDFAQGAETARRNAIAAYERVLQVHPKDEELRRRVTELRARHDTNQRRWYSVRQ